MTMNPRLRCFREGAGRFAAAVTVIAWALATCAPALALNPALDVSQYAHKAWKMREGFTKGQIWAIAQTPDGYLWLATEFGLLRFDGVKAAPWEPPPDQPLPSTWIVSLLAARDGTLWIGTSDGLASWKDGKLTRFPQLVGQRVYRLIEDREGSVWAGTLGTPTGRLCAIQRRGVRCYGEDGQLGVGVVSLYQDKKGSLWVGVMDGVWRWNPGAPEFHSMPGEIDSLQSFAEADDGALLIGARSGIRRLVDRKTGAYRPLGLEGQFQAHNLLRDRDGSLWIGTRDRGLLHVHEGRTDVFAASEGLSGNHVVTLFEDREGSIWVATQDGLDRFHGLAVVTFGAKQGLSGVYATVQAAADGTVWLGSNLGLNHWNRGEITVPRTGSPKREGKLNGESPNSLFLDDRGRLWVSTSGGVGYLEKDRFVQLRIAARGSVNAFAEDAEGNIWIADRFQGLFRVSPRLEIQQTRWADFGRTDFAAALVADPSKMGLWLGFFNGGIAYVSDGRVRVTYAAKDGLGEGPVHRLQFDRDGTLWAATDGGLSRLKNGRIATMTHKNGLPCDPVQWALEDDTHALWLYMPCGLVRIAASEIAAWSAAADAAQGAIASIETSVFDGSDGVGVRAEPSLYTPIVAKSTDGRLWFQSYDGVSVIDPSRIQSNKLPPPVHIEQVVSDRTPHAVLGAIGPLRLPALSRDLEIDYTALSLVAPEKNLFKVMLEGWDNDWQNVGTQRQKFYGNLPPRDYRFRVIASNNSGVWNETGDTLEFTILPAYYQTTWFAAVSILTTLALLWGVYQWRLRQVAYAYESRLQERVNERTRIARELHDTLLQSFHGLLFRFQAANNMLPDRPSEAKQKFDGAIDQAAKAITDGREAVQNLRASAAETNDLEAAISTLTEELAAGDVNAPQTNRPLVNVAVQGTPRALHPIVRDDIYRIAGEALRNAFRHAEARHIEVEIRYNERELHVRVRDDGKGIDASVLDADRPGHFGLPGMRERAELIGGHLNVWSQTSIGTEIELAVPAAAAYAAPRARRRFWSFAGRRGSTS
jgi:signal transduction histidine kinase/ligand-binding sensor domain-containing protein